jgi:hypothetical protein
MTRLNKSVTGNSSIKESQTPFAILVLVLVGISLGMVILATARSCDKEPQPATAITSHTKEINK